MSTVVFPDIISISFYFFRATKIAGMTIVKIKFLLRQAIKRLKVTKNEGAHGAPSQLL
jgi:hypothetical protein